MTPRNEEIIAITGGYVVPVSNPPISNGTVLLRGGRIADVGDKVKIPRQAQIVDATGTWVLPGFVEAHAHLGVHEEAEGWAGHQRDDRPERCTPARPGCDQS